MCSLFADLPDASFAFQYITW